MLDPTDCTVAMIVTPCAEGITRNNYERAELAYTAPGVSALLHAAACARRAMTER
jgi:hypothetical protein